MKLVSVPDVPDTEKLSWLMLGRAPDPNARDNEALTAAAASLIASGGTSLLGLGTKGLGLDSVGMRSQAGTAEQVAVVRQTHFGQCLHHLRAQRERRRQHHAGALSPVTALVGGGGDGILERDRRVLHAVLQLAIER